MASQTVISAALSVASLRFHFLSSLPTDAIEILVSHRLRSTDRKSPHSPDHQGLVRSGTCYQLPNWTPLGQASDVRKRIRAHVGSGTYDCYLYLCPFAVTAAFPCYSAGLSISPDGCAFHAACQIWEYMSYARPLKDIDGHEL